MSTVLRRVKPGALALVMSLLCLQLKAQNCNAVLERAEMLFEQGIIEDIPSMLTGCIRQGFSPEQKMRARKLVILSFIYDNNMHRAEIEMAAFLQDNPEYVSGPGDPPEFSILLDSFETFTYMSVGGFIGGNISLPVLMNTYGPYGPDTGKGSFAFTHPEFHAGGALSWFLDGRLEIGAEGIYSRNIFSWSDFLFGISDIYKKELIQKFEFPVSLTWDLPGNNWTPYVRAGVSGGLLARATALYSRNDLDPETGALTPVATQKFNISHKRNSVTFSTILGLGLKYKVPGGHFYLDARYWYGLSKMADPESRWDDGSGFLYYHADSDYFMDYFTFSAGYRRLFYRSRKKR